MPGASPRVAAALGTDAAAIDLNSACTGFVAGLSLACGQIESGRAANVLLVGADLMSRITDPDDRGTAAVFADGAGAVAPAPPRAGPDRADRARLRRRPGRPDPHPAGRPA